MAKELPASATEIAGVAEAAGQLGIETENILKFTRTMIDLGEATNLTAEQAATQFARFANIVGMSQKDFDRLGSTVVALGNNFATTEAEIVEMAMRLAGAGAQIGLTEAQIMAFATALSSVGIEAEMGGSALSKVMVQMQLAVEQGGKDLKNFAKVAGMSAEDFRKAFEQDAARAIMAFLKGLSTAEERGMSAIAILDEMGIKESRLRDTLLRAAGAYDVFNNAVELGNKAWKENTALTEEAHQRYETTESRLRMMWNRIKDVAITLGDALAPAVMDALDAAEPFIKSIENGAKAFSELDKEQQRAILRFVGLVAAIGPASLAIGSLSKGIGGLLSVGSSLAGLLGAASGGTGLLAKIAGLGMKGPVGLAVAGIGVLTAGIISFTESMEKAKKVNLDHTKSLINQQQELQGLTSEYEELSKKNKLSNDELLRYKDIESELKFAKTAEEVAKLKDEQEKLQKKSGLTNEELDRLIALNDEIIEKTPDVEKAYSERGNAIIKNRDALDEANQRLAKHIQLEMDNQRIKMEAQLDKNIRDYITALEELMEKEAERDKLLKLRDETEKNISKLRIQAQQEINAGKDEEARKTIEEIANQEILLAKYNAKIVSLADEITEKRESVQQTEEEIKKTQQLYDELINLQLASVGINDEGEKGIEQLDQAISKTQERIKELQSVKAEQGNLNQAQEEELKNLQTALTKYENAKTKIQELQGEQAKVNQRINEGIGLSDELNESLGKDVDKQVNIDDGGEVDKLNKEVAKTVRKKLIIESILTGARSALRNVIPGFKKGTDYAPGGLAMVGEEGPELIRYKDRWALADFGIVDLPRGAQVFTHAETKRILNAVARLNNIPGYATGARPVGEANRIVDQLSNVNATSKQPVVIQLVTPERRVMAEWLVDDITEIQRFKEARIRMFLTT